MKGVEYEILNSPYNLELSLGLLDCLFLWLSSLHDGFFLESLRTSIRVAYLFHHDVEVESY